MLVFAYPIQGWRYISNKHSFLRLIKTLLKSGKCQICFDPKHLLYCVIFWIMVTSLDKGTQPFVVCDG